MGGWEGETGLQLIWAIERAERFGIRILCTVSMFPTTFSQKLLAISSGKGSLAPKSPKRSPPMARGRRGRRLFVLLERLEEARAEEEKEVRRWEEKGGLRAGGSERRAAEAMGGSEQF